MLRKIFNFYLMILFTLNVTQALALPAGFVYIKDIDPTIIENLRYFSSENFVGRKIEGYLANRVILTKEAAEALAKVQRELIQEGYSIVVYDAYRPQRAVNSIIEWSSDATDQIAKTRYYPSIDKADIFKLNYIAKQSGHSRGSTVDLSIIKIGSPLKPIELEERQLRNGKIVPFLDDGTLDMGTSFDLFNEASHHDNDLIDTKFMKRRNYLREIMKENGFSEYKKEWWHYTLKDEPFPETYFDFPVE
jgi:D-alanyl-D-alanine dipeptidase